METEDRNHSVASENCILVRLILSQEVTELDPLAEIRGLAETAGSNVVGELIQKKARPEPSTYLGKGKIQELKGLVEHTDSDVVIFDNDLSPGQVKNLESELKVKVLDRTEVILDIFANHAQTHEARLAVELAQMEYSLPRLKRMWTHLSRIKHGIGMRGPGEKQLETDRRLAVKRIHDLKSELSLIEKRKERQVASRRENMTVSLVGYTNAGKSTLMNVLTKAEVLAQDKLFATLDTRTRRWRLPNWGPILLSDTVGFIRNLPHKLIASFKATLEEAHQADLLLHVADASNPSVASQIVAVSEVLSDLGISEKSLLLIFNKIDQVEDPTIIAALKNQYPHAIFISAVEETGLPILAKRVSDALSLSFCDVELVTDIANGKLVDEVISRGEILSTNYGEEKMTLHCRLPQRYLGRLAESQQVTIVSQRPIHPEDPDPEDSSEKSPSDTDPLDEVA
ncbi:MAG: GTPase HflX [Pirellulaceae bacterium]|nr:GTPase HflX [Pirellulaceae bacterium]